jgi:signal transduction histidine kinase
MVGIVALVLVVHDLPLASHLRRVERDRVVTGLERDAFTIAGHAEEALEAGTTADEPALTNLVVEYSEESGARVVVTDSGGTARLTSDAEATVGNDYSTRPEIASALEGSPVTGERDSRTLGQRLLYVAVPVLSGSDVVGTVRITYPASVIDDRVDSRVRGLLVVALISILSAAAAAVLMAGTVTRPLRRLRHATEELAGGDLEVRADTGSGPPEIRSLAGSFNTMAERTERLVSRQRAFAGDASHQLRTPLTALRLRLEQAADAVDTDPATARERIEAATGETERLQHLVDGLLVLARAEGRDHPLVTVDVTRVLLERVELWRPFAEEQSVRIDVDAQPPLEIIAIDGALEQVVDNLVDNAINAAPAGTTVELQAGHDGRRVTISVLDRGPGMTAEQCERAFDRFWRAPDSATATTGSGLGLAIVHQLMTESGGDVVLRPRTSGGLEAVASFTPAG